ncbi:hypothetical protein NPIL_103361 [Nephila pilipes]|uniref:DUF4817 domain-containing protein n=1 Tax=Nephila pilipes TaxID=299642 RepID=A0A8X6PJZ8_NEPPI|nr:hypothetical protein NPIL_103361 [Nephila pilipes]
MNKYSTDVRVFIVLQMARCDENVKAVQRAWQEKFHNKNWPNKRTMARLYAKVKRTGLVEDDKKSYGYSHCYCGHRWCKTGRRRLFRCRSDPICKESSRNVGNKAYITSANNERARIVALQNSSNPTSQRRPYTKMI